MRIDFEDGGWWELRDYLSHAAAVQVKRLTLRALKLRNGGEPEIDWSLLDPNAMDEALLLASTLGWSYGPVSAESLANIPEGQYAAAMMEVNRRYGPELPLDVERDRRKRRSPRSFSPLLFAGSIFRRR